MSFVMGLWIGATVAVIILSLVQISKDNREEKK